MPTLQRERVTAPERTPEQWLLVLHGIYGAGRNWRSVAKRTIERRPEWGAVLVDLREHGGSQGFAPPHTIEAAADDLNALADELELPTGAILGHSLGGKVALDYARRHGSALEQVWVVDSTPAAREPSGSAWEMLQVLRRLPESFESRQDGVRALEDEGVATPIARWMATNLERSDDAWRWRIDLDAMEELLRDFFRADLWGVVEDPPAEVEIHFIKARDSGVLTGGAAERVECAGRENGRVFLHRIAGGHWLNAENPEGVVGVLANGL